MASKKVTVTKIGVGSFARFMGVAYALVGLVVGLIATVSVAAGQITGDSTFIQSLGISLFALGWGVIIYPFIFGLVGWIQGGIIALVANVVFKESNGLELELEDK